MRPDDLPVISRGSPLPAEPASALTLLPACSQREIPLSSSGLGVWGSLFDALTLAAVISNSLFIVTIASGQGSAQGGVAQGGVAQGGEAQGGEAQGAHGEGPLAALLNASDGLAAGRNLSGCSPYQLADAPSSTVQMAASAVGGVSSFLLLLGLFAVTRALIWQLPDRPRWLQVQRQRLQYFSAGLDQLHEARALAAAVAQEKFDEKNDALRIYRDRAVALLCAAPNALLQRLPRRYEVQRDEEAGYWITLHDTDEVNYVSSEEQEKVLKMGTFVASLCACLVELV